MLLFFIAFLSGVLTVLAPCILPLLPIIVGGSISGGVDRLRAYTVCASLAASVILFTLILKASTALIGVPQYVWEGISGVVLIALGMATVFPALWEPLPFLNRLSISSNKMASAGFRRQSRWGDVIVGAALGPVFTTCSPTYFVILATVLPAKFSEGIIDLLAYTAGLSITLLAIALIGQRLVDKLGLASDPRGWFRRSIGILFVLIGLLIFTGAQRTVETWLLDHVFDVTKLEQKLLEARGMPEGMPPLSDRPTLAQEGAQQFLSPAAKAGVYQRAPELVSPDGYINTGGKPISIGEFKGKKVVLIDFWTYSCINCQRTLPYLRTWYDKYKDQGLEIIGVHTPEFAFEQTRSNVEKAAKDFGLAYPIVQDNEYRTWNAFGNQFWPRKYLIDIDGYIIYDHAGEGQYEETEAAIQHALAERAARLGTEEPPKSSSVPEGVVPVQPGGVGSPETYFGAARNEFLGTGVPFKSGAQYFEEPLSVVPNTLYLIGSWDVQDEYAQTSAQVGGSAGSDRIDYHYRAKNVYFVAGVAAAPIEVEVLRDSAPLHAAYAGKDIYFRDGKSYFKVDSNRLYHVIGDSEYGDHLLELIISKPGLQAYTFTFG